MLAVILHPYPQCLLLATLVARHHQCVSLLRQSSEGDTVALTKVTGLMTL